MLRSKLFASIALALVAGTLAWLYLDQREGELLRRGKMVRVIAASHYISAYSRLKPKDLEWRQMPEEYVVKGYISSDKDAVDQLTLVAFNRDEPLTYNKLNSGSASLANSIPEGKRAFSLHVDKVTGIAGLVKPGDLVDVLYLKDAGKPGATVTQLFQGVKVLAAGDFFSDHQDKFDPNGSITLALGPEEAQVAMLASNQGALQLSLRSIGDSHLVPSGVVHAGDLNGLAKRKSDDLAPESDPNPSDFIPKKR